MDLRRLIEALHASRHSAEDRHVTLVACPFHGWPAFEREARRVAWLLAAGIGRRS